MERHIAIYSNDDDRKLLFLGKFLAEDHINEMPRWKMSGLFLYEGEGECWKNLADVQVLKPEDDLFIVKDLSECEHFLMLLKNQLPIVDGNADDII